MYQVSQAKKLVSVSTIFMSVTSAKTGQKVRVLNQVACICYSMQFWKNKSKNVLALLNFGSKVNAMIPAYVAQLGLKVQKTNVSAQKMDGSSLKTYCIVIAAFQVCNKLGRFWFFQKTFLLADISIEVVLDMPFLTLNNADIKFAEKEFI